MECDNKDTKKASLKKTNMNMAYYILPHMTPTSSSWIQL